MRRGCLGSKDELVGVWPRVSSAYAVGFLLDLLLRLLALVVDFALELLLVTLELCLLAQNEGRNIAHCI